MGMGQNLVPLVNIKIAGKWMFIPLKMVLIGIDPYPYVLILMFFFHRQNICEAVHCWLSNPKKMVPQVAKLVSN